LSKLFYHLYWVGGGGAIASLLMIWVGGFGGTTVLVVTIVCGCCVTWT